MTATKETTSVDFMSYVNRGIPSKIRKQMRITELHVSGNSALHTVISN